MKKLLSLTVLVFALASFSGCSAFQTSKPVEGAFEDVLDGAPVWVVKGCDKHFGDAAVVCGVGSVTGTRNLSLARSAAQGRGRTEIARTLRLKVKAMLKDYQATMTGGDGYGTAADDEQVISDTSKQITDMSLPGSKMADTWISEDGSTLFALMVLDMDEFNSSLRKMKSLDPKLREAVEARAEKSFKELDTEGKKAR